MDHRILSMRRRRGVRGTALAGRTWLVSVQGYLGQLEENDPSGMAAALYRFRVADSLDRLRFHFDARASSYSGAAAWVHDQRSLDPIRRAIGRTHSHRCLEIGVGTGAVPGFLHRSGAMPDLYVGVDLSLAMLKHASCCLLLQASASDLPFGRSTFDMVVVRQAFHYFDDPSGVVAEIARVIQPTGALIVAQITPFASETDIAWWSRAVEIRQPLRRSVWNAAALAETLQMAGFRVETIDEVAGRSSLNNWLNRYDIDESAADQLRSHFRRAPDSVQRVRDFVRRAGGDIEFSIRWSILLARRISIAPESGVLRASR